MDTIATDVKEAICRVSDYAFLEGDNSNMPTVSYEVDASQFTFCDLCFVSVARWE